MNKNTKYFIIIGLLSIIILSYFLFNNGFTDNLIGNANKITYIDEDKRLVDNYPIITSVINSSDEDWVNSDVVITINAKSNYNIKKIEYSYDMKKWKVLTKNLNSKVIKSKITFKKNINKKLYLRVTNEKGFKSYAYKTYVKIDKKEPEIKIKKLDDDIVITVKDNNALKKLQYSDDEKTWEDEIIEGKSFEILKENFDYKFIRVVDNVGNISKVVKVK